MCRRVAHVAVQGGRAACIRPIPRPHPRDFGPALGHHLQAHARLPDVRDECRHPQPRRDSPLVAGAPGARPLGSHHTARAVLLADGPGGGPPHAIRREQPWRAGERPRWQHRERWRYLGERSTRAAPFLQHRGPSRPAARRLPLDLLHHDAEDLLPRQGVCTAALSCTQTRPSWPADHASCRPSAHR